MTNLVKTKILYKILKSFLIFLIAGAYLIFLVEKSELIVLSNKDDSSYSSLTLRPVEHIEINNHYYIEKIIADTKSTKQEELILLERQAEIKKIDDILYKYNSPFAGLGYIIYEQAEKCGGDYKILFAIAGNESGFGRIPYKKYNPFGYLNNVQYSSWEESLTILSCRISEQHLSKCGQNLQCLVNRYGGSDTNQEKWIQNITWFMSLL